MDQVERTLKTLRVMWLAFLASLGTFIAVLVLVDEPLKFEPLMPVLCSVVALVETPVIFFFRWQMLGTMALRAPEDLRAEGRVEGEALDTALLNAAMRYQTVSIVSYALVESVALLGFMSSYVTGSLSWYLGHAAWATVLFLLLRPTQGGILSVLSPQEREGVRRRQGLEG